MHEHILYVTEWNGSRIVACTACNFMMHEKHVLQAIEMFDKHAAQHSAHWTAGTFSAVKHYLKSILLRFRGWFSPAAQ